MQPLIGIVLGSYNDVKRMQAAVDRLTAMGVPFEMCIASAHRTPDRLAQWLRGAQERGVRVVIAGAGASAHLPGVVASKTLLPVIGVPFNSSPLGGVDALYSIVQMPPGIPVATVGVDSSENAALLALHILGISDPEIREKLRVFRAKWHAKIEEQNKKLYADIPHASPGYAAPSDSARERPAAPAPPATAVSPAPTKPPAVPASSAQTLAAPSSPAVAVPARTGKTGKIRPVQADMPDVAVIEEAVDVLLDGGVIALPTDTVYGLAADATNPVAVAKLYEIKKRSADKPLAVLIDSTRMFRTLVTELPQGVEALLERHWPGPLTLVARKRKAALQAISRDVSLGLRMPDSVVALGLISMLGRPVAATSANLAGQAPARTAQEIAERFGDQLDLILDAGPAPETGDSTVLSLLETPFRILREGPVTRAILQETLENLLD
jgi:5-(carboxyamino)imidazole ribonucleotide mutase